MNLAATILLALVFGLLLFDYATLRHHARRALWIEALVFVVGAFFIGVAGSLKRIRGRLLRRTLGAMWLAVLIAGMFDVPVLTYDRPEGNTLFGMLVGITLIAGSRAAQKEARETRSGMGGNT